MVFKRLRRIINRQEEIEDYSKILHESGLLQKIERIRLEIREREESPSHYQLYPCHREYSSKTGYVYNYNRFDEGIPPYTVSLGDHYFRIRARTEGIFLSFRHIQKVKSIKRMKINPLEVSEKEISEWFSFLKKHY